MLKEEIKQSFVNLSAIVDPDIKRKRKITLKEWTNWMQHDHLSEAEHKMFNDNPEHVDWRNKFLRYSWLYISYEFLFIFGVWPFLAKNPVNPRNR